MLEWAVSEFTPDQRDHIEAVLKITGHELAGRVNYTDQDHLLRLLRMGLVPSPRRSLARFVLAGWLGKNPNE